MKKIFLSIAMWFALAAGSNAQNTSPFWSLAGNSNATGSSKLGTTNANYLGLFTNNIERMRITPSGLVGIGTTNPLTRLHVNGVGSFGDNVTGTNATRVLNLVDANAVMRIMRIHNTNAPAVELLSRTSANGDNKAYWDFYAEPTDASFRIRDRLVESGAGFNRLTILHTSGNVGIGTTTPSTNLHVSGPGDQEIGVQSTDAGAHLWTLQSNGTSGAPATFQIIDRTAFASRLGIDNNGNIGIGNVSPGFPLNFPETLGDKISLYGNTDNHYGFGIRGNLLQIHSDLEVSDIAFGYGSSEAFTETMRIKGNGNVGIGTASPARHLHVFGSGDQEIGVQSSDFGAHQWTLQSNGTSGAPTTFQIIDRTAGASRFGIDNNGNVGIGTGSPAYKLSVNGTIQAKEARIETGWADYVFEKDYKLSPLENVADFIKINKHLPGVPSAKEIQKNGLALGEMQTKLIEKIEELTLYLIDLNERVKTLENENATLMNKIVNQNK